MTAPLAVSSSTTVVLSGRDLAALREALVDDLEVQQLHVRELTTTIDDLTGQSDSDSLLEREVAERSRQRALENITDIHDALRRMDADEYGRCQRCGGPIALERLQAIPFTRYCVGCAPAHALIG